MGSVWHLSRLAPAPLLRHIPCGLVDDRLMGIGKDKQLVLRRFPALLGLEVLADRLAQHGMSEILLVIQNIHDRGVRPEIRVIVGVHPGVFGMVPFLIGRGYQNLVRFERVRDGLQGFPLRRHVKYSADDGSSFGVNAERLLVVGRPRISIGNRAAAPKSVLHPGLEDRFDLLAGVLCIKIID